MDDFDPTDKFTEQVIEEVKKTVGYNTSLNQEEFLKGAYRAANVAASIMYPGNYKTKFKVYEAFKMASEKVRKDMENFHKYLAEERKKRLKLKQK